MIGNKHSRLYRYIGNTIHNELKLPCNCDVIESVHLPLTDAQLTDSTFDYVSLKNVLTERYIEAVPTIDDPYYNPGKLAKYKLVNDTLCFDRNFKKWKILGTFVWPNDDELTALDTWDVQVEYTRTYLNNSLNYLLGVYTTE
jgi:hypothetical protein